MGEFRHQAAVAMLDEIKLPKVRAFFDKQPDEYSRCFYVSRTGMNGYVTAAVLPYGSKLGWKPSEEMNEVRAAFLSLCEELGASFVEVEFGGFMGPAVITEDSGRYDDGD